MVSRYRQSPAASASPQSSAACCPLFWDRCTAVTRPSAIAIRSRISALRSVLLSSTSITRQEIPASSAKLRKPRTTASTDRSEL